MKVSELHQIISRNGWVLLLGQGKEINNAFAKKILKDLGIHEES